jgi:hypothetical protein
MKLFFSPAHDMWGEKQSVCHSAHVSPHRLAHRPRSAAWGAVWADFQGFLSWSEICWISDTSFLRSE